jgi:hypothetical protein
MPNDDYLLNSCKLDASGNDSVDLLITHLPDSCPGRGNLARVHLAKERNLVCVNHGREELRVQGRVSKAITEHVPSPVLGMLLGITELLLGWTVVPELAIKCLREEVFEYENTEQWRDAGYPSVRKPTEFQAGGYTIISIRVQVLI